MKPAQQNDQKNLKNETIQEWNPSSILKINY